jgi:hypothetical protein
MNFILLLMTFRTSQMTRNSLPHICPKLSKIMKVVAVDLAEAERGFSTDT